MPSAETSIPLWERPPKTTYGLDWAHLSVIDISRFDEPGEKLRLAEQLREAIHKDGFFSVIGTGFTEEEVVRQLSIGQAFFEQPLEEKNKPELSCDFSVGNYFGYRGANAKKIRGTDVLDNIESINIPKFTASYTGPRNRQPFLQPFESEIADFSRRAWEVVRKLFVLCAIILELPEDFFVTRHLYEDPSDDHLRYMLYHPRSAADDEKVENMWSRAHTDFGSLTVLWSQNVAGLQIRTFGGEWKYVKPIDNGLVCNVGDTLQFWSAGYFKSTIHRVVRPPPDQAGGKRLGLFYFSRPGNDADIKPAPSPVLKRLGLVKDEDENAAAVKGLDYVRMRVKDYHHHTNYENRKGRKFKVGNLEIDDEVE